MSTKDPNLLLVYDIPDDRKRTKIADACLDYGLDRIQFSAFLGWLLANPAGRVVPKGEKDPGQKAWQHSDVSCLRRGLGKSESDRPD